MKQRWLALIVLSIVLVTLVVPAQAAVVFSNWAAPRNPGLFATVGTVLGVFTVSDAAGFAVPAGPNYALNSVSVCVRSFDPSVDFTLALYDDVGGWPGSPIASLGTHTVASGATVELSFAPGTAPVVAGGSSYFVVATASAWGGWCITDPPVFPSGVFTHTTNAQGFPGWLSFSRALVIEIDADPVQAPPTGPTTLTPRPGCDALIYIPPQAVMGTFTDNALVYWMPGEPTSPPLVIEVGKSYWVSGLDESGLYYQVLLSCDWVWVEADKVGPNYDAVWGGRPLPTDIVEVEFSQSSGPSITTLP
jgi:hypothetical protein